MTIADRRDPGLLAVPWLAAKEEVTPDLGWDGRIRIDATNILLSFPPKAGIDDLGSDAGSEIIAWYAHGPLSELELFTPKSESRK